MSQHLLPFFPISSPVIPSNLPHLSQYLLSFFPITSLILPSNLPYMSQHSLSFFPWISPILPMNFPHLSHPTLSTAFRPIILSAAVPLPVPSQFVALGSPFVPSPFYRSTPPPPSSPAASLPLSFSGSSHICLQSPPNLLYLLLNIII